MKRTLKFALLFGLFFISFASAQGVQVFIEPANPDSEDVIRIGVQNRRTCMATFPVENTQNLTHFIEMAGFSIELNAVAYFPIPVGGAVCPPAPIAYYELGILGEGNYSLSTWLYNQSTTFPHPSGFVQPPARDTISFSVSAPPVSVPLINQLGLLLLFILMFSTVVYRKRKQM